ncbi:PREDICTED: heterogeneous nuclear ribonucleoprotein 1-like [Lupinus angustifolius]|uniref:heterogeneous nuclear ribonucleoprotein 1-like n=1 Tax=Lupinus angustifolius TaxID=3871 RepID=UPI00092E2F97|nr:PREDICTED: heterogeneous nuclear ribonucleoprotein 1-like [Lupinus angustifolius]
MDYYPFQHSHSESHNGDEIVLQNHQFNPPPHNFHANHDHYIHNVNHSFNRHDSLSGKLFVGGISWETSEETFFKYFNKFGEVVDSVIMMDKHSGRPRGFGFVTFTDSAVADKVLAQEHTIDGRVVEVKRTVPRGDMEATAVFRTKKIFVGGIPQFLTDDELKEYFSPYGNIVEHQIMLDYQTGRSRGFGFVTFDSEDSVEKVVSAGIIHELGGKQVEIKRAEPKRSGVDYSSTSRKSYVGFGNEMNGFGGHNSRGHNIGRRGGPYTDSGMNGAYSQFDGSYGGNSATAYGGYCGYGYGFGYGGPMYCFGGYGVNSYVNPGGYGAIATYGDGNAYGRVGGFNGTFGYDSGKVAEKDESPANGRYHPYWK